MSAGLFDTSVWIAAESRRPIDEARLPDEAFVSVITLAELQAGVLAAADTATRAARMATLSRLQLYQPLTVDATAAGQWAVLRVQLHEAGRAMGVNDLWIAAIAVANQLPIVTQDQGFDVLQEMGVASVIRV